MRAIARDVRSHFQLRAPEWLLALMMAGVGFQFMRSDETLFSSPSYQVLAWLGSDTFWGTGAFCVGGFRFVALVLNGTFKCFRRLSPVVRAATSLVSAIYWFSMAAAFILENQLSITVPILSGLMAGEMILSAHIATEAGRVQRKAPNAPARD